MQAPQQGLPLRDLLTLVGDEFAGLAGEIERLQDGLSQAFGRIEMAPDLVERAQALDHVFQHMTELGLILGRAALQTPDGCDLASEALFRGVTLTSLVTRLSGQDAQGADSGELEMF